MNDEVVIEVTNLKKTYHDVTVVDEVSFQIKRNEIFSLLGPNGSGKTTLISMLSGLIPVTSGVISIFGMNFSKHGNALKQLIGFAPQTLSFYDTLSARDNLLIFGGLYGLRGKKLTDKVCACLEMVNLHNQEEDIVEHFSGGMKRRLNLAIALMHEPKILFLDEPSEGIDAHGCDKLLKIVQSLNEAGMTIIYTSHRLEEAEKLSHKIAIIDQGKLIALNTPAQLCDIENHGYFRVHVLNNQVPFLLEVLASDPLIIKTHQNNDMLQIETRNLQKTLINFLQIIQYHHIEIDSLHVFEQKLRDVFLKLTDKNKEKIM